jgi:hypothetical protein
MSNRLSTLDAVFSTVSNSTELIPKRAAASTFSARSSRYKMHVLPTSTNRNLDLRSSPGNGELQFWTRGRNSGACRFPATGTLCGPEISCKSACGKSLRTGSDKHLLLRRAPRGVLTSYYIRSELSELASAKGIHAATTRPTTVASRGVLNRRTGCWDEGCGTSVNSPRSCWHQQHV